MRRMMDYQSDIVLGRKYRHKLLDIEGFAEAISFYKNSCERVVLIYTHEGELKDIVADSVELIDVETEREVKNAREAKPGGPERRTGTRRDPVRR
jgi:hypothetical protein